MSADDKKESVEYPLFLIDDKDINKISGPVLCYYMTPNKELFDHIKDEIHLPLMLLFGDSHGSVKNMCKPCVQESGCFRIYDKNFLDLLGSLGTEKYKVDFYVETFMDYMATKVFEPSLPEKEDILRRGFPMDMLIYGDTEICFKRGEKGNVEYERKCPNNIRWHYSDVRNNFKFLEGNMYILYNNISNFTSKNVKNVQYIESIKDLLLKIAIDNDDKINIFNFSKYFLESANSSLIVKQLSKHSNCLTRLDENIWEKIFTLLIESRLKFLNKYKKLDLLRDEYEDKFDINKYSELIVNIDNIDYIKEYKKNNESSYYNFLTLFDSIISSLLDMYFITRVLKGKKEDQASLVVSYLGFNHLYYIMNTLNDLLYEVKVKIGDENIIKIYEENRCLDSFSFIGGIHETINLTEDVRIHNLSRES